MTNQNHTTIQTPKDDTEQWAKAYIASYKTLDDAKNAVHSDLMGLCVLGCDDNAKKPFHLLLEQITHLQETSNSIQVFRASDAIGQRPLVFEPADLLDVKPY